MEKQQIVVVHAATTPAAVSVVNSTSQVPVTGYVGTLPWCDRCNYHHRIPGPCRAKFCRSCGQEGHLARTCKTPTPSTSQASGAGIGQTCYSCGEVGHYKRNCPKTVTSGNTGRVLTMGQERTAADPIVATGILLLDKSCTYDPF